MKIELKPMDVVVVDGLWYMPHHWLIRWRSFNKGVHCFTVGSDTGEGWSPEFNGIQLRTMDHYEGRRVTIHRFKGDITAAYLQASRNYLTATGYDFRQWIMGGIIGLTRKSWVEASDQYTCSEFPYRAFQDAIGITPTDDTLPLPRMFRFHPQFETVFDGIWEG